MNRTPEQIAAMSRVTRNWVVGTLLVLLVGIMLYAVGCPQYRVYQADKRGEAALKQAENEKLVQIEEARANLESERFNAQAEVVRAEGAAEAIQTEAGSLTQEYIQYLWVRTMDGEGADRVYVPTEAGLPILEGNPAFTRP